MGRKEEQMIAYYKKSRHFSWLLNGWLHHGKVVVEVQHVEDMNVRYTGKTGKRGHSHQRSRYRDVIKKVDHVKYVLLLGTEMQTYTDYSMPVRVMDYDALEYNEQIQAINTVRKSEETGESRKLELSRLRKEDRLIPVITLVLYIGKEPWDAAKNLHGILDLSKIPEELLAYIPDYQIQVLDVCHTTDERLLEFPSDISCMFLSMKYCDNFEKLSQVYRDYPKLQCIEEETYETIWNVVDKKDKRMLLIKNEAREEGGINMCKAVDQMLECGRKEGIEIGMERGMERGQEQGIQFLIESYQEIGSTYDNTQFQIELKYHLDGNQAEKYMQIYWKE